MGLKSWQHWVENDVIIIIEIRYNGCELSDISMDFWCVLKEQTWILNVNRSISNFLEIRKGWFKNFDLNLLDLCFVKF